MSKNNRLIIFILHPLYLVAGIFYYYKSSSIPIEFTSSTLRSFYILSILIATILIFFPIAQFIDQITKPLKFITLATGLTLLLHNLFWTIVLLNFNFTYSDEKIIYQDPDNKNHKVIEQYLDEGAMGDDHREVEVIELIPGLRYIKEYR